MKPGKRQLKMANGRMIMFPSAAALERFEKVARAVKRKKGK